MQGKLSKWIGYIRLIYALEILNIIIALLFLFSGFGFFLALRVICGFIGGISVGILPPIIHDMFSHNTASFGESLCYFSVVLSIICASVMDKIFGGTQGLTDNHQFILAIPSAFGFLRLICLTFFLLRFETPQFWMDKKIEGTILAGKVLPLYLYLFIKEDAE